jgi:hypothetical protein
VDRGCLHLLLCTVACAAAWACGSGGAASRSDVTDILDVAGEEAGDPGAHDEAGPGEDPAQDALEALDEAVGDGFEETAETTDPGGGDADEEWGETADASPDADAVEGDEGLDAPADAGEVEVCSSCAAYGAVTTTGSVASPLLKELSGLAPSRVHPGIIYAHNDSGDFPRFFAFDLSGVARGEWRLASNVFVVDWEDMAAGPCEAGTCLYFGDFGDNFLLRASYAIYVVPEPSELDPPAPQTVTHVALPYRYPDGPHNAEAILVHPATGDIYVVTKAAEAWDVFVFPVPHAPDVEVELEHVGVVSLPFAPGPVATGGSVHPCGDRILLRTYGELLEYRLEAGQAFEEIFGNAGALVPVGAEGQGEAVTYEADGLGYLTASEGAGTPIHEARCAPGLP